eukprot:1196411-Prorocentrum_minimum.AAC.4
MVQPPPPVQDGDRNRRLPAPGRITVRDPVAVAVAVAVAVTVGVSIIKQGGGGGVGAPVGGVGVVAREAGPIGAVHIGPVGVGVYARGGVVPHGEEDQLAGRVEHHTTEGAVQQRHGTVLTVLLFRGRRRRTNQTQEARVYSHDGPIRRRRRGYILTTDQSDAGGAGIFSRRTNQTQEARVYSHGGPIGRRRRGYILTADQGSLGC